MAPAGRRGRPEAVNSLSRNFHSALCIAVRRGAKFGGALAPPPRGADRLARGTAARGRDWGQRKGARGKASYVLANVAQFCY